MLLAPEFAPITFSMGVLEPPLDVVAAALQAWYAEQAIPRSLRPLARVPFPAALAQLEPLSAPGFRRLWVATTSPRWRTAYFDGFINGTDAFAPVSYLAQRMGCHTLIAGEQPNTPDCYGAAHISLYGPAATDWLNLEWKVSVMNDGGRWTFQHSTSQQPFEELEAYTRRRIRDRLSPEMLRRYCGALEVPLDPAAFGPECILDDLAAPPPNQRRETLAQARARFGLGHVAA